MWRGFQHQLQGLVTNGSGGKSTGGGKNDGILTTPSKQTKILQVVQRLTHLTENQDP